MFVKHYQGTNIMLEDFLSYIVGELSVNKADKLLLAVSGGVDSMVMLDLFHRSGFNVEVAHVNHSTRNGQSDKDAEFVIKACKKLGISFHIKVLDYNELSKANFQSNARNARYSFFKSIRTTQNIKYLATAHHMDDRWETFVMNLNRKSGIVGLTSLKPKSGNIIRPLMGFTKSEIGSYSIAHNIAFVEDASNNTDDYTRNKIRHHLTEEATNIFPDFVKNVNQSIINLEKSHQLIDSLIQAGGFIDQNVTKQVIDIEKVKSLDLPTELLYHITSPIGFSYSDTVDILSTDSTGAMFYSSSHEALYNRGKLIIRTKRQKIKNWATITNNGEYRLQDGRVINFINGTEIYNNNSFGFSYPIIDSDKVILRSIKPGDKYKPEHMNGKTKTLKKLLNDLKVDRFTKEDILVLEINGEIKKIIGINDSIY